MGLTPHSEKYWQPLGRFLPGKDWVDRKLGFYQPKPKDLKHPSEQSDDPAEDERRRRVAGRGRSTILTGALGPAQRSGSVLSSGGTY